MVLRAVDDPTNHLHIVSALRTPLLGLRRRRPVPLPPRAARPLELPGRPARHGARRRPGARGAWPTCGRSTTSGTGWRPRSCSTGSPGTGGPSSSASPRAGRATCGGGCASSSTRPGPGPRRRAATCASTSPGCRQQAAEGARVAEAILPETDDDAVRIMTIHAAKGLEFPITIVSGMSTAPGAVAPRPRSCSRPRGVGYRFSGSVTTEEYEAWKPIDEQMGSTSGSGCSTWPAPGPGTTWSCRCTARPGRTIPQPSIAHQRRAAGATAWVSASTSCPTRPQTAASVPARVGRAPPPPPPPFAEWRGRAHRRPRRAALPADGRGHRADRRGHVRRRCRCTGRRARSGLAEATAGPRPPALVEGPLRHRGRPGRARRPPDDRSRDRGRARSDAGRPVRGRGRPRTRRGRAAPRRGRPRLAVGARGRGASALAGGVRVRAGGGPPARGIHRPPVPRPRRPRRRGLQDVGDLGPRRARPAGSSPTATRARPTRCRSRPRPGRRCCGSPSSSSRPTVPSSATSRTSMTPWTMSETW